MAKVEINEELCIGCGKCVKDCVSKALALSDKKARITRECLLCGHCVAICPVGAPAIPEYGMDEVVAYDAAVFTFPAENFLNAVKFRRSIRNFKEKKVEKEKLERIIAAGKYTPTGGNTQGVRFIVVQEELPKAKELIWEGWRMACDAMEGSPRQEIFKSYYEAFKKDQKNDRLFFNAPALIVIASNNPIDGGLAGANMEMMAVAEGLGVLYDGYIVRAIEQNPEAKAWLGTGDKAVVAAMMVGYPNITYQRTAPRRKGDILWK